MSMNFGKQPNLSRQKFASFPTFCDFAFNLCRSVAENFFVFLGSNAMNSPKH